jgi:adenosylcobinamide kinase/adenosylcobinamide-phosphate guanylyltransferase
MQIRIDKHILQRKESFISIEEPKDLVKIIKPNKTYLIDCVSMWIFNNLSKEEETLKNQLREICKIDANIVFILNDVSCGVIPMDKESRRFVDFSGLIGQELSKLCDEVYEVKYSLERRLK